MNPYVAEIIGTGLLLLLGSGVVANVVLPQTKGHNSGWLVITTAWALAVFTGVVVAGPYSGAHLNPAVTVGLALAGKFDWAMAPGYIGSQVLGAGLGAFFSWLMHVDHFKVTKDPGEIAAPFGTKFSISFKFFPTKLGRNRAMYKKYMPDLPGRAPDVKS